MITQILHHQTRRINMEFQKLIEERRTIRKYSPEGRITKEDLLAVIRAAQEAPSWKNSQTGRYYCVMSEEMVEKVSRECLPEMNQAKAENASLIVTTFVHSHSGFQKDRQYWMPWVKAIAKKRRTLRFS